MTSRWGIDIQAISKGKAIFVETVHRFCSAAQSVLDFCTICTHTLLISSSFTGISVDTVTPIQGRLSESETLESFEAAIAKA